MVFTSSRERRLWLLVLIMVAGMFATLGLAPRVSGFLREAGLLEISFGMGTLLVALALITQGLGARPGGRDIGLILGVAAVWILVIVRLEIPVLERTHLIEYAVITTFIHEALRERKTNGAKVKYPALLALTIAGALGVLDEGVQYLLPTRVFDLRDILFNILAAVMAVLSSKVLAALARLKKG